MNKSIIIIVIAVWLLCAIYLTMARSYGFPYANAAMVGSWIASVLLLVCVVIYIRKHRSK